MLGPTALLTATLATATPPPVWNGDPVEDGARDEVALLWYGKGAADCTGVLVAPRVVLTAAHCVKGVRAVSFGTEAETSRRYPVSESLQHPRWGRTYDVGVLVLDDAPAIAPAVISTAALRDGATVEVVGWGATNRGGWKETDGLRSGRLQVIDVDCEQIRAHDCNPRVSPGGELVAAGEADSCPGDSGGPLYQPTASGPKLVGIVSRGIPGGRECGQGGVYVRTDAIAAWVEEVTGATLQVEGDVGPLSADWGMRPQQGGAVGCAVSGGAGGAVAAGLALLAVGARRRDR